MDDLKPDDLKPSRRQVLSYAAALSGWVLFGWRTVANAASSVGFPIANVADYVDLPIANDRFKINDFICWPGGGVGQIVAIEDDPEFRCNVFVINWVKDMETSRLPIYKSIRLGMRKPAAPETVKRALETLRESAQAEPRHGREYWAKINAGDILSIAEVIRDLVPSHRSAVISGTPGPTQSHLYEKALYLLAEEVSFVKLITETEAVEEIEAALAAAPSPPDEVADDRRERG